MQRKYCDVNTVLLFLLPFALYPPVVHQCTLKLVHLAEGPIRERPVMCLIVLVLSKVNVPVFYVQVGPYLSTILGLGIILPLYFLFL